MSNRQTFLARVEHLEIEVEVTLPPSTSAGRASERPTSTPGSGTAHRAREDDDTGIGIVHRPAEEQGVRGQGLTLILFSSLSGGYTATV